MDLNNINNLSHNKVLLLLFTISNCNPCKLINTCITNNIFEYKKVQYIILEIDKHRDISDNFNITVLPTIVFYKNSEILNTIIGYEANTLLEELKKYK